MAYVDLRQFIKALADAGELITIDTPVSAELEIAEITDRVSKSTNSNNKALLFTNVKGYEMPVLINAFGSMKRMCLALEVNKLDDIAARIKQLIKPKVPETFMEKLALLPTLVELGKFPPKLSHTPAPCQEVVITNPSQSMLDKLPIITCWPEDAGPFVTLGTVITRDPATGIRNLGIYRLQKYSNSQTGMHWHKHHDGAKHFEDKRRQAEESAQISGKGSGKISEPPNYGTFFADPSSYAGEYTGAEQAPPLRGNAVRAGVSHQTNPSPAAAYTNQTAKKSDQNRLEVAVALGCDPAITYAASAPLPPDIDELLFAGFLRQNPVRLTKCKTIDLEVPASAEIILEGYVDQSELKEEGPFGDHTGFYSLAGLFPVFHVTAVTHRRNPIYQTIIVGKPPQEDCYLGKATERIFLPLVQMLVSEITDMNLPWEGVFHNCVILSIDKRFPGHARKVMSAVWGLGQMMFSKFIIVVDKDVNVHDLSEVALNVFGNTDPRRDMMFVDGPLDILDHSCPILGYGSKVGIDATRKWKAEGFNRDWPKPIEMSDSIAQLVSNRWSDYGFN